MSKPLTSAPSFGNFPDEATQKTIEQLIAENISRFTQTLSPKTMSVTGKTIMTIGSIDP